MVLPPRTLPAAASSSAMAQTLTAERELSAKAKEEAAGAGGGTKLLDTRIFELKVRRGAEEGTS